MYKFKYIQMNLHEGWVKGERWRKEVIHSGEGYCISPGRPSTWGDELNLIFKKMAYTAERGIDWDIAPVAERAGDLVIRGAIIEVDDWLYKVLKTTQTLCVPSVWTVG